MIDQDQCSDLLARHFERRRVPLPKPSHCDWDALGERFACTFPDSFKAFMTVVSDYHFEGGLLRVCGDDGLLGEDTIASVYESEMSMGGWPPRIIPFYDVGNGDYYGLSRTEMPDSFVYYCYHEDRSLEKVHESFESWVRSLPDY